MKKIHSVYMSDIEDLIISKYFIEQELLKNKIISEKMSLDYFVSKFINVAENFITLDVNNSSLFIPFYIYDELKNDTYIFFSNYSDECEKVVKMFSEIEFDFSKLVPYSNQNIMIKYNNVLYSFEEV